MNKEVGVADYFETTACDGCMHVVQSDNDMSFNVCIYYESRRSTWYFEEMRVTPRKIKAY